MSTWVNAVWIGAARRTLRLLVCAIAVASAAAPSAGAATAGAFYFPIGTLVAGGSGPGQVQAPGRVGVEPGSGDVIVADTGNDRVDVFGGNSNAAGAGAPLTTFAAGSAPFGVAVDPGNGNVYISEPANGRIARYTSDGASTPTYTLDATFSSPAAGAGSGQIGSFASPLAVDPTSHDLLVADTGNHRVSRYTASGSYVGSFNGSDTVGGAFTGPDDIAAGPTGAIYVIDGASRLEGFDSAGRSTGAIAAGTSPNVVATNPSSGVIYVAGDAGVGATPTLHVVRPDGSVVADSPYDGSAADTMPTGIAVDASGQLLWSPVKALGGGSGVDSIQSFFVAIVPGVDIDPASQITSQRVHLSGSVDPGGIPTTAYFQYSDDNGATWQRTPDQQFSGGSQSISADIDVDADRTYIAHLYAVQNSASQTTAQSSDITFTTPAGAPRAVTEAATDTHMSSAVVHALINPFGAATTYRFEYGETAGYGSIVPVTAPALAGAGRTDQIFQQTLTGLKPGTIYHYRVIASSANGTANGADETFTTPAAEVQRAYEQVTPVDKQDTLVNQVTGFQARPDGGGLIFQTTNAAGGSDTPSATRQARVMSLRGASGWTLDKNLDVPVSPTASSIDFSTIAVSSDLTRALVVSNRRLTDGALGGGLNLYLRDTASGSLKLIATADASTYLAFAAIGGSDKFMAGASDFSWFVFTSPAALTADAQSGVENAYRWTAGGGLQLISRMPDGTPATVSTERRPAAVVHVTNVSATGTRALLSYSGDGVYLWDADQPAQAISVSHRAGDPATPQPGHVVGLSRDGRQAVFMVTSSAPLTNDAPAAPNDIYRLDLVTNALTYLGKVGDNDDIQSVYAISEDAQTVYIVRGSSLLALLPGGTQTVATVPELPGAVTRGVSPSGRYLAFTSAAKLTSLPTGGRTQVYLYDATSDSLSCASCPQGGTTPTDSAILPDSELTLSNYYPRAVTDDGSVYFSTATRVVSADVNSSRDVYMFNDGAAHLISPGDGSYDATFADAAADGSSVFFTTSEPIVRQDHDKAADIYVSRVGGGFASQEPQPSRAACGGDECAEPDSGPTTSPSAPTQGSSASRQVVPVLAKARISSVRTRITSRAIHVTVRVSGRGRIRVSGRYIKTTVVNAGGAGSYTLVVSLGQKARSAVIHHRRLKASIRVSYTPPFGKAAVSRLTRSLGK